jgi:SAM-dependent methyltransferase
VVDEELAAAKERGWREIAEIDEALADGRIDEDTWHGRVLELIEGAYLSAPTPQGQSGHSGDDQRWEYARRLILDGVDSDGSFLDIGCANGLLMESVAAWARQDGRRLEPYGVEISARLATLARERCPQWADRIWTVNALHFVPPRRFDYVRTGLDYVPPGRGGDFVGHLLAHVVAPDGRLVVGTFNEERDQDLLADEVASWGYRITGTTRRPHRNPKVAYKVFWIDGQTRPRASTRSGTGSRSPAPRPTSA